VVAFEPDAAEAERMNRSAPPGVEFVPAALWSREGTVDLHVAAVPSTSSVHAPNAPLLKRYEVIHSAPRATREVVTVPATTLDRVLDERGLRCDFLKVDVQGAEFEVLRGASLSLDELLGAVVETWTVEVHAGQRLTGAVLEKLAAHGLDVFDINVAAAWYRRGAAAQGLEGRRQVTGLDVLALRDPPPADPVRRAKAAAIADAYGFTDVAAAFLAGDDTLVQLRSALAPPARSGLLGRLRRGAGRVASLHE
jgi:FkbM family methyltransferase